MTQRRLGRINAVGEQILAISQPERHATLGAFDALHG